MERDAGAPPFPTLPRHVPPAPEFRSLSALQLARALQSNVLDAFAAEIFVKRHAEFRRFGQKFICLTHPDDLDHVLNAHLSRYAPNVLARRLLEPIVGEGILFAEGAEWRRQHDQLVPFFQPRNVLRLAPVFHEAVEDALEDWPRHDRFERDLLADFRHLTLAVIARALFSIRDARTTQKLADFASRSEREGALLDWRDGVALLVWRGIGLSGRRLRIAERSRRLIEDVLASRVTGREASGLPDMIDALGDAPKREVVNQASTMLSAGFITTAIALFWSALMLALHPAWQEEVRAELCAAPPDGAALRACRKATAFVYETLRLFPPAYIIVREALEPDLVGDLRVQRGAAVVVSAWVTHRHTALWAEPLRFEPSRFLVGGAVATPRAWLPFGVGPRVCLGANLATLEMLVILRSLLSRYQITVKGEPPRIVGRVTLTPEPAPGFVLTPI